MAQHDYVIDNASGATVRADINSALSAIQTLNSGTSAPSSTAAGMLWLDTTGGAPYALKIRDAGNNHWLTLASVTDPGSDGNIETSATIKGTIDSSATLTNATFPSGHIINIQEFTNSDTTDTWTSNSFRTICSGAYATSNSSNKLLFLVNAFVGISETGHQMYSQISYKTGTSSTFTHDGTPLPEGVNSITGNTNIQRVAFQFGGQSSYSNSDEVSFLSGQILHAPGTTDSRQYQLQVRGRTDISTKTARVNAAASITNGGYENYGVTRMTIMEIQQ
jgi:hypothetical protein